MNNDKSPKLHADCISFHEHGFVNGEGEFVIDPIWENAFDFYDGLGAVKDSKGKKWLIDLKGRLFPFYERKREDVVVKNGTGRVVRYYKNPYDLYPYEDADGKEGYVNAKGEIVIPCKWYSVDEFSEGLAWVYDKENDIRGYINTKGELVFTHVFHTDWGQQSIFSNGLACVEAGKSEGDKCGTFGYIDNTGKVVIPFGFSAAYRFSEKRAFVRNLDGKWGMIDMEGNLVTPFIYDNVDETFEGGTAWVLIDDKWRLIDRNGKFVPKDWPLFFEYKKSKVKDLLLQLGSSIPEKNMKAFLDDCSDEEIAEWKINFIDYPKYIYLITSDENIYHFSDIAFHDNNISFSVSHELGNFPRWKYDESDVQFSIEKVKEWIQKWNTLRQRIHDEEICHTIDGLRRTLQALQEMNRCWSRKKLFYPPTVIANFESALSGLSDREVAKWKIDCNAYDEPCLYFELETGFFEDIFFICI